MNGSKIVILEKGMYFLLKIQRNSVQSGLNWEFPHAKPSVFFNSYQSFVYNLKFTSELNIWLNVVFIFLKRHVHYMHVRVRSCSIFCVTLFIQMCIWLYDTSLPLYILVNVNLCQGFYSPPWPFLLLTPSSLLPGCWDLLPETCSLCFWHQLCINNNKYRQLLICNDTFITMGSSL